MLLKHINRLFKFDILYFACIEGHFQYFYNVTERDKNYTNELRIAFCFLHLMYTTAAQPTLVFNTA